MRRRSLALMESKRLACIHLVIALAVLGVVEESLHTVALLLLEQYVSVFGFHRNPWQRQSKVES